VTVINRDVEATCQSNNQLLIAEVRVAATVCSGGSIVYVEDALDIEGQRAFCCSRSILDYGH
jgi:hypothetical protein